MAFSPITFVATNYRDYSNWWLKAYEPGTTTPKPMSDNDTGSPQSAKYEIDKDGWPVTAGSAIVNPHIDGDYDIWLFPTEAEADANDTTNALRLADDLSSPGSNIGGFASYQFDTVVDAQNGITVGGESVTLEAGDVIQIKERASGLFDVIAGTGGANGTNVIAHATLDLSFVLREYQSFSLVKQYGAVSGQDVSAIFEQVKANYGLLMIPNGIWLCENLSLNNNDFVWFESRNAIIQGVTASSDIFVSSGAVTNVNMIGGRINQCGNFLVHTGNSALASSTFQGMYFTNLTAAFDLSSSVGVTWRDNEFGNGSAPGNIQYGILFRKNGTGQTNQNAFFSNRYGQYSGNAVRYENSAIIATSNNHYHDWFEDSTETALYIGGSCVGLKFDGCYFETTGGAGKPDVLIEQSAPGNTISAIKFDACNFLASELTQTERIRVEGNAAVATFDCASLLEAGQVFAAINGSGILHSELQRTRLNAADATGTYEERLFSQTGTQQVSWSNYVDSAGVTGDSTPVIVNAGIYQSKGEQNFPIGDATPDVMGGTYFRTSGTTTITDFLNMNETQRITVRAGNTITVIGVNMVLDDVADFVKLDGVIRHVNL